MQNRINKHRKRNKRNFMYFFVVIIMVIIGIYLVHMYQHNSIKKSKEQNSVTSKKVIANSSNKRMNENNVKIKGNSDKSKNDNSVNNNFSNGSSNEAIQDEQYHILRAYQGKQIYVNGIPEYDLSSPNNPKLSKQFLKWEANRYNVQSKDYWGNANNVKSPSDERKSTVVNSNEQDSSKNNSDNNDLTNNNQENDDINAYEVTQDSDDTVNVKNNKTGEIVQKKAVSNPDWDYVHDKQIDYSN